jgi:hypothetical protein
MYIHKNKIKPRKRKHEKITGLLCPKQEFWNINLNNNKNLEQKKSGHKLPDTKSTQGPQFLKIY